MSWYAIDAVDDAIDATRRFLFPFSLVRWTKLAVIALFIGGGGSVSGNAPNLSSVGGEYAPSDGPGAGAPGGGVPSDLPALPGEPFASPELIAAAVAGIAGLAVLLAVVSTVLRFVFYDALRTDVVALWGPFKRRFLQGIRLILFQIGVTVLVFAPVGAAGYGLYLTDPAIPSRLAALLVGAAVLLVVFATWLLVLSFTNDFVVPIMVLEDETVLGGWSRFWPTLKGEWVQFLVYLVVYFFLSLGIGIGQSIVTLILGGIVIALGAIAGLVVVGLLGGAAAALESIVGLALLGLLVVLVVATLAVVVLPIRVLVLTYLTTYQLTVLGGANSELMLLPDSVLPDPDAAADEGAGGRTP
ncbi:MAG: hypothetical protein V5A46_05605 [Haloferacaceae archaeon]